MHPSAGKCPDIGDLRMKPAGDSQSEQRREDLPSNKTQGKVWAILTVVLVVVAGVFAGIYIFKTNGPQPQPSGLDFFAALAKSNQTIANLSGGPWKVVSALAIVTTEAVWPSPFQGSACQQYAGVSVWNSSRIPIWTGSLSSGVSPFWSIWYLNESRFLLAAFTVGESIHIVGPVSPTSVCGENLAATLANIGLGGETVEWTSVDSSAASQVAWNAAGRGFASSHHSLVIYYELDGAQQLVGISEAPWGWAITYSLCGGPGFAGSTSWPDVLVNVNRSDGPANYVVNGADQCSLPSYHVFFSKTSLEPLGNGSALVTSSITVNSGDSSNASYAYGLLSWMTGFHLMNQSDSALEALANVSCTGGDFNDTSCRPSGAGWYAALAEPDGYWLDVFSDRSGNPGWALPNVPYYTGDSIILYLPSALVNASLALSILSTTEAMQVSGQADL